MSLHVIEIAAAVAVAIAFCRLRGLLCRHTEPLTTNVARCEMHVKNLFQPLIVIASNPPEHVQLVRIAGLQISFAP